ncbi:hypothetical protein [Streptomyces ehimensis]|uniref:Uncharacterized protein n=1 Tax=Streptomyces ehimensis TaxID=68195 RepID=A0ABV9BU68_9ACTN
MLQREFAAAPAIVVVTGHLAGTRETGARGYTCLMTSGGQAAGRAWTAAITRGGGE